MTNGRGSKKRIPGHLSYFCVRLTSFDDPSIIDTVYHPYTDHSWSVIIDELDDIDHIKKTAVQCVGRNDMGSYHFRRGIGRFVQYLRGIKRTKRTVALSLILSILLLSGCASMEDHILYQLGILSEEDRQKYIELRDSGLLDPESGYVTSGLDELESPVRPSGSVHVTFARNLYIEVQYYLDQELTKPVGIDDCYLMPGDCIYYDPDTLICSHPVDHGYSFERFGVYPYDNSGERGDELSWGGREEDVGLVLQIPTEVAETEIAVMPLGKYEKRSLELTDYYTDSTGRAQELTGTWIINDQKVSSQTVEVSSVEPLAVDLEYDAERYCFVSSSPGSFYHEDGLVRFETVYASDAIERYVVEFRSLEGSYLFDPAKYPAEHGKVEFTYLGRNITEKTYISDGGAIWYMVTPDAGYRHPKNMGQVIVNVSDPDATDAQLREAVRFYPDGNVDVILPRPVGGTIEYTVNGKVLDGDICTLPCGSVITLGFTNWNGWICNVMDGKEYVVTEQEKDQSVSIEGVDLNYGVFVEAEDHKPRLDIVLTDSVKDVVFAVSASGIEQQGDLTYEGAEKNNVVLDWLGQNDRSISIPQQGEGGQEKKPGTEQGITLEMTDDTLFQGYALKLDIVTTDIKGNERHEIRYIGMLPAQEKIQLYEEQELASSTDVYKGVRITVSKVEISPYTEHAADHAKVTVLPDDITEPFVLKEGDLLEPSRDVRISIVPEDGYYVIGAKDDSGVYQDRMSYSKWEKDREKILDDHPVKKLWHVTLDSSDSYGDCVYKLDGLVVSGKVPIHEGQKLVLEYTLTDPEQKIERSGVSGFLGGIFHSGTKSVDIPVSEELDGKTVRRSDYIGIGPKEG